MNQDLRRGSVWEPFVILAAVLIIIFLFVLPGTSKGPTARINPLYRTSSGGQAWGGSGNQNVGGTSSSLAGDIVLSKGNSSFSFQPYEEYVILSNKGSQSVDLTGWTLKNNKESRPYELGGNLHNLPSDTALIPKGTVLYVSGNNQLQNIVLKSDERAIVTSGKMIAPSTFPKVSFKENKCTGYLEGMDGFNFTPSLAKSCPLPKNEPGVASLSEVCRDFVRGMPACHIPNYQTTDRRGQPCPNCVDDEILPSACIAYLQSHFNYNSCVANHKSDNDFSGDTWRIYLGSSWELWAKDKETISVLDNYSRLVDYLSY